jgi:hypothetical protein
MATDPTISLKIRTTSTGREGLDTETLLVGTAEGDYRFARMAGGDGVFKIHKRYLEPIIKVLGDPKELRSRIILPFD